MSLDGNGHMSWHLYHSTKEVSRAYGLSDKGGPLPDGFELEGKAGFDLRRPEKLMP